VSVAVSLEGGGRTLTPRYRTLSSGYVDPVHCSISFVSTASFGCLEFCVPISPYPSGFLLVVFTYDSFLHARRRSIKDVRLNFGEINRNLLVPVSSFVCERMFPCLESDPGLRGRTRGLKCANVTGSLSCRTDSFL